MTTFLKWTAYYLLYIPALFVGYLGESIIPERKDVAKMSLTKAIVTIIVVGSILIFIIWLLLQFV